eukprot:6453329-Pyramimonas_sp.AAC.1
MAPRSSSRGQGGAGQRCPEVLESAACPWALAIKPRLASRSDWKLWRSFVCVLMGRGNTSTACAMALQIVGRGGGWPDAFHHAPRATRGDDASSRSFTDVAKD